MAVSLSLKRPRGFIQDLSLEMRSKSQCLQLCNIALQSWPVLKKKEKKWKYTNVLDITEILRENAYRYYVLHRPHYVSIAFGKWHSEVYEDMALTKCIVFD